VNSLGYLPLADIAVACGVSAYQLINHFWPEDWAVPRDFRLLPRSSTILVAEASLPQLVTALYEAGLVDAAARLEAWRRDAAAMEPHENFMARHTARAAEPKEFWFREGQYG
jgi:hypothetical protein